MNMLLTSSCAAASPSSNFLVNKIGTRSISSIRSIQLTHHTQAHHTAGSREAKMKLDISHPRRLKPTRGKVSMDLNEVDRSYRSNDPGVRFDAWKFFRKGQNFERDMVVDFASLSEAELATLLRSAATSGDIDAMEEMLHTIGRAKKKKILDMKDPATGVNAVMLAAQEDHHRILRRLLQEGANYRAIDSQGSTAIDYARSNNSIRAAVVLASFNDTIASDLTIENAKNNYGGFSASSDDPVAEKFLKRLGRTQFNKKVSEKRMAHENRFDNSEQLGSDIRLNYHVRAPQLWLIKRGQQVLYVPKEKPERFSRSIPQVKVQTRPWGRNNRPNYYAR